MLNNSQLTITDADVDKLKDVFVTKTEFHELKDMVQEIIFQLRNLNQEVLAITYRNREHTDQIENHASRITKIEEKIAF